MAAISAGKTLSPEEAATYADAYLEGRRPIHEFSVSTGPVTGREREVAQLVAEGLTNREIAERLCHGGTFR